MSPRLDRFPDDLVRMAQFSKAIGHPARLDLLHVLAAKGPSPLGDLVTQIPLAASTVTQHLVLLERSGLVHVGRGAREYVVDREALEENGQALSDFFGPLVAPQAGLR